MDNMGVINIVIVITVFISLFLAFFLTTVKTEHKLSNRLFAFFLVLTAIDISGYLFNAMPGGPSDFGMMRNLVTFLHLPIFYLYVKSVSFSDFDLKPKHLVHTIAYFIANLMLVPRFYAVDDDAKVHFITNITGMWEIKFNHVFLHLQIALYLVAIFVIIRNSKIKYLENYAGASLQSFQWLFRLTLSLCLFYGIALFKNIFKFSAYSGVSEWLTISLFVFTLVIICWYLFQALNHPDLFRKIDSRIKRVDDIISEEKEASNGQLSESENAKEILKLKTYMEDKKPFLNPSLTIQDVSDQLKIPVRDLSLLINHTLGQHFFDFVNAYRIESAKKILENNAKNKMTILEILYEVGFNSKSSFNTAFKKHAGTTPTLYRKSL